MNNIINSFKNSKVKNIIAVSSLCSALLISGASFAVSDSADVTQGMKSGHHSAKMMKRMARKLELTESQQTQMAAIKQSSKADMAALKPAFKAYKEQEKALISADIFDEQAFSQLRANNQDVFTAQALIRAKTKFEMKQVLTPEQLEKFNQFKAKRKNKRNNH